MITDEAYRTVKDLPLEEYMAPGNPLCAGCGGLLAVRLFHKALGGNVVWVNAAGCMTMLSVYPYSPLQSSWLYTAFASAPAGAQGIRDALDLLIKKGKVSPDENLKVVVVTGDGAAYDIGLQSTLGAVQRKLDFYYLCYDNEAYGNTGFQMSSSTPYGSASATTEPTSSFPEGNTGQKKDLFEVWKSQKPSYLATISTARTVDFMQKVEKSTRIEGPKLFISPVGCPTGWGYDPQETIRVEKLGLETGIWPLKEYVDGVVKHTYVPGVMKPVEQYLETQTRYRHLFRPEKKEDVISRIQEDVNRYWTEASKAEGFQVRLIGT